MVPGHLVGILALAALAAIAGWIALAVLQQDFAAYFTAGRARALGLDPYRNHLPSAPGPDGDGPWDGVAIYRHSRFLYPPLVADLFRPLAAALPFSWAKAVFTAASVAGLWLGVRMAAREMTGTKTETETETGPWAARRGLRRVASARAGFLLLAAALWPPVLTTLERGQIDLLLLPLLALAWRHRDRPLVAGPALGVVALGKPFTLVVLPLLACAGRGRTAAVAVGAVAAFLGLGALSSGTASTREYLGDVLPRATLYGEGGPAAWLLPDAELARASAGLEEGTAQLDGRGRVFLQEVGDFRRNASLVRLLSGDAIPAPGTSLLVLGVLGACLAFAARRRPESPGWYWAAFPLGVLGAPVSWAMSLSLALPLFLEMGAAFRARAWPLALALVATYAAGLIGPIVPGAWCASAFAGIAAGALMPAPALTTPERL